MSYKCLSCNGNLFKGPVEGWYNCLDCGFEFSKLILAEKEDKDVTTVDGNDLHAPTHPMESEETD